MIEIKSNISESNATFFYIKDNKIALSELTRIDDLAKDYVDLIENINFKNIFLTEIKNVEQIYFYSRLNVPQQLRGLGVGSKLLKETIEFCEKNNYMLINTVNPYGDLSLEELNNFYQKGNMLLLNNEGLLVYSKNINQINRNVKNNNSLKI